MEHLLEAAERAESILIQREMPTDASDHATCFRSSDSSKQEFGSGNTQIFETAHPREELNASSTQTNSSYRDYVPKFVGLATTTMRNRGYLFLFNSSLNSL